jgi:peptidoglycan/xylan/chitin deacetylase (PgdA/CDA1 family)
MSKRAIAAINAFLVGVLAVLVATAALLWSGAARGLDDGGQVPVLLYHPQTIGERCDADDTDVLAMQRDLQLLHDMGFVPTPARHIVEWRMGLRAGNTLPAKPVVITTDDGHDRNYLRRVNPARDCAADLPSVREIAEEFDAHVTMFVIGSPVVRRLLGDGFYTDSWWLDAERHPLLAIQNHTAGHEHQAITRQVFDPAMGASLPAAGHADGDWTGQNNPLRWTNRTSATVAIARSGIYIWRNTGHFPDFLAHPFGVVSPYVANVYLPSFPRQHEVSAAFCTEGRPEKFVSRTSPIFCLPRVTRGLSWFTAQEFVQLMGEAK